MRFMNNKKIGIFLIKLRKNLNMTQYDLSKYLYVNRETISKWERGIYIPNAEILIKLSKLYNVSINEILYGEYKNK